MFVLTAGSYVVIVWCNIKIWRFLQDNMKHASNMVKEVNSQLNKTLLAQVRTAHILVSSLLGHCPNSRKRSPDVNLCLLLGLQKWQCSVSPMGGFTYFMDPSCKSYFDDLVCKTLSKNFLQNKNLWYPAFGHPTTWSSRSSSTNLTTSNLFGKMKIFFCFTWRDVETRSIGFIIFSRPGTNDLSTITSFLLFLGKATNVLVRGDYDIYVCRIVYFCQSNKLQVHINKHMYMVYQNYGDIFSN